MSTRMYTPFAEFNPDEVSFALGKDDRQGKPTIHMHYGVAEVAFVTPACVTNWPRVTGDGNFGTMWGPQSVDKAKFTLDLCDAAINGKPNELFDKFSTILEKIDDKLLDFIQQNQLRILGRKNLSRDELRMLQIRTVRPKLDKMTGAVQNHTMNLSASKYVWDGMGGKFAREINVCDKDGQIVTGGAVSPGDVIAATVHAQQVYTGVGGDKFGIQWGFEDVQVVCQRTHLAQKTEVPAFGAQTYDFAAPYMVAAMPQYDAQFSDQMVSAA